jgi:hypothetical protein
VNSPLVRILISLGFLAGALAAFLLFRHAGFVVQAVVFLLYLSAVLVVIAILLNSPRSPRRAKVNELAKQLESQNLLHSATFHADRAFRVAEFAAEGPHYFLELEHGGILHLCGSYLCDYEPLDGAPRHFPCTEFTVRRHSQAGYVVDLICGGLVIEPEVEAPPYTARDFQRRRVPKDGDILRDIEFVELREQRMDPRSFRS